MQFLNERNGIYDSILKNIVHPFMLKNEFRKYVRFIRSFGKAAVGRSCIRPLITPIEQKKRVLVIAPHPDDEILGCGGTIKKYVNVGSQIKTLILTDGRYGNKTINQDDLIDIRIREAKNGLNILGCDDLTFFNITDTELRADNQTIEKMLKFLKNYRPEIIFAPFFLDNNTDHMEAALVIAKALKRYEDPLVCYCYEVWTPLFPNVLIDITKEIRYKSLAMDAHQSQITNINLKSCIIGLNSYRSMGFDERIQYCEAFYKCSKKEFIMLILK